MNVFPGESECSFSRSVFASASLLIHSTIGSENRWDGAGHYDRTSEAVLRFLRGAQEHPENYKDLLVRVATYSAYFVELDKEYQDHVIARTEFGV